MNINISPVFFDYFGFVIWLFILWISLKDINNYKLIKWKRYTILFIAIIGIFLDGLILFLNFFNNSLVMHAWKADFLGIPAFLFIIYIALTDLKNKKITRKNWTKYVLLSIGILGLIADGFILVSYLS